MSSMPQPATRARLPTLPGRTAVPAAGAPVRQASLSKDAWYRYIRNRGAFVAAVVFLLVVAYCLVWPLVSPYDPYEVDFSQARQSPSTWLKAE